MALDSGPFGLGISNCRDSRQVVQAVHEAEELGANIAFVAEDVNCRDAFQLAALSATRTQRIELATGVVNPYTRNPTSLAMAAATLDELSNGRAVLGMGTSSPALISGQMGIEPGSSITVMKEATLIIRQLLAGHRVTYEGEHFSFHEASLDMPTRAAGIPIYFAAMGPRMLRLAGAVADGVLLNVGASTEYISWAVSQIEMGALKQSRDVASVTVAAWLGAYVTDDYDAGVQSARELLATMLAVPRQGELLLDKSGLDTGMLVGIRENYRSYPHSGSRQAAARHVPPDVAEKLALVGDRATVLARLDEYRAAGVGVPVLPISALRALR